MIQLNEFIVKRNKIKPSLSLTFKIQFTRESPFQKQMCLKSSNYPL